MITESWPWRRSLRAKVLRISRAQSYTRLRRDTITLLEHDILVAFFEVRKLIDARTKIPKSIADKNIPALVYPSIRAFGNWQRFDIHDHFDLSKPSSQTLTLQKLTNQFIHSLVFSFAFDESKRLRGVYVVSDFDRGNKCHLVTLDVVKETLLLVENSEAKSFQIGLTDGLDLISND